jgi:hypothetical protein
MSNYIKRAKIAIKSRKLLKNWTISILKYAFKNPEIFLKCKDDGVIKVSRDEFANILSLYYEGKIIIAQIILLGFMLMEILIGYQ